MHAGHNRTQSWNKDWLWGDRLFIFLDCHQLPKMTLFGFQSSDIMKVLESCVWINSFITIHGEHRANSGSAGSACQSLRGAYSQPAWPQKDSSVPALSAKKYRGVKKPAEASLAQAPGEQLSLEQTGRRSGRMIRNNYVERQGRGVLMKG